MLRGLITGRRITGGGAATEARGGGRRRDNIASSSRRGLLLGHHHYYTRRFLGLWLLHSLCFNHNCAATTTGIGKVAATTDAAIMTRRWMTMEWLCRRIASTSKTTPEARPMLGGGGAGGGGWGRRGAGSAATAFIQRASYRRASSTTTTICSTSPITSSCILFPLFAPPASSFSSSLVSTAASGKASLDAHQRIRKSFMTTSATADGGGDGREGGGGAEGYQCSDSDLALLDDMFQESARTKRKQLRERNRILKEKQAKGGKKAAGGPNNKSGGAAAVLHKAGPPCATTEEEALAQAKVYRKVEAPKRLVELTQLCLEQGLMTPQVLKVIVRAEMDMKRQDLAGEILEQTRTKWLQIEQQQSSSATGISNMITVPAYTELVRWCCRLQQLETAREILNDLGINGTTGALNDEGLIGSLGATTEEAGGMLTTMGMAFIKGNDTAGASRVLREMVALTCKPTIEYCNELLRLQGKRGHIDGLFATLDLMREAGLHPNTDSYQHLGNTLVRSVDFVAGAVSMETLPTRVLPEVCFIGRSNVGKSSLLNMVCNRKDLAYVSKRPGKTQQFNYFLVNDKTRSTFYMVDVPGIGYAKVPLAEKSKWGTFFESYLAERESLRVVFHLIDARHGPLTQDLKTMEAMGKSLGKGVKYVIVLTKADKKDGKVSSTVFQDIQTALESNGLSTTDTPVIVTSAVNRLGRDDVWRYLRLAVLRPEEVKHKEVMERKQQGAAAASAAQSKKEEKERPSGFIA